MSRAFISALLSIVSLASICTPAFADGLVQLRPINGGEFTSTAGANTGTTVRPWEPNSNGRIDASSNYANDASAYNASGTASPYKTGVSVLSGDQKMTIRLNDRISSQDTKVGDTISATLESPLMNGTQIVAPAGSEVLGSVVEVDSAKRLGLHGEVDVRFYTIVKPNGERVAIDAVVLTKHGGTEIRPNNYVVDAAKGVGIAAGGTAAGALGGLALGGIFGAAGTGAALGTAVGATAGIGFALWRQGKPIELPKGTLLQLQSRELSKASQQAKPI